MHKPANSREAHWVVSFFGMDPVTVPEDCRADVAIAIGIGTSTDGVSANGRSAANSRACRRLWESRQVDHIMLVGGAHRKGGVTEAEGMRRAMNAPGPLSVEFEKTSRNTEDNAKRSLKIMQQRGWKTAIICAEALHARRVKRVFTDVWRGSGCTFIVVPTYGAYDDQDNWKSTPWGFLIFDTVSFAVYMMPAPVRKIAYRILGRDS